MKKESFFSANISVQFFKVIFIYLYKNCLTNESHYSYVHISGNYEKQNTYMYYQNNEYY